MPPPLSLGLNLPQKKPSLNNPAFNTGRKRKKTIFDSDSEDEARDDGSAVEISTMGGLLEEERQEAGPTKRKPTSKKPLNKKTSIFADDDEDRDDDGEGVFATKAKAKDKNKNQKLTGTNKDYTNLAALHSSKKHAQEAQDLDPSIYSYDAVYDSLHADKSAAAADGSSKSEVPRYMNNLLRSAEIRKRDQLRARERMLAKEREAEGDEFADKEKFVTAAYKAQQEELRRMEAEEERREKEEEENRRKNPGVGMLGFYRDVLSRGEQRHEEVVKAVEEAARRVKAGEVVEGGAGPEEAEEGEKEKSEAQIAAELNARGANVVVNDDGQIVDKRQLLSAGLNVAPKPKPAPPARAPAAAARSAAAARTGPLSDVPSSRAAQRARQTEMIAAQLEQQARQEEEAEAARQKEIAERTRSRKTEGDVMSAKERYLARKREREEAAAKAKGA